MQIISLRVSVLTKAVNKGHVGTLCVTTMAHATWIISVNNRNVSARIACTLAVNVKWTNVSQSFVEMADLDTGRVDDVYVFVLKDLLEKSVKSR